MLSVHLPLSSADDFKLPAEAPPDEIIMAETWRLTAIALRSDLFIVDEDDYTVIWAPCALDRSISYSHPRRSTSKRLAGATAQFNLGIEGAPDAMFTVSSKILVRNAEGFRAATMAPASGQCEGEDPKIQLFQLKAKVSKDKGEAEPWPFS